MKNMHAVHLTSLDLNLLVALDALLAERHVTRAASRIGLSQSAMSHALARIREVFDDPMLVRTSEGMYPTDRALALEPQLRRALGELSVALAGGGAAFEPRTSQRTFSIGTTDYAGIVLLPALLEHVRRDAPGIDIVVKPLSPEWSSTLGVGAVDVVLGPARVADHDAQGIAHEPIWSDRFRCVVRRGHPLARGRITVERYVAYPHVMVAPNGTRGSFVDDALALHGHRRRVACMVPHFLVAPHLVARTDLVLTASERVVCRELAHLDLVDRPLPIDFAAFSISMLWHERNTNEPGHTWFRDVLRTIAGTA